MHKFTQKINGHYENDNYVFFWRGPFSNFHKCVIKYNNLQFNCSEQLFMVCKAELFNDHHSLQLIMRAEQPLEQKRIGRTIANFEQPLWDINKYYIMREVVYLKFSQNKYLKKILLDTGEKIICEASPYDAIWGIKMGVDHPDILDENKWKGQNLLGHALMNVRRRLSNDIFGDVVDLE